MSRSVYREDQDAGRQKHYDSHEGVYRVDRMTWFINKVRLLWTYRSAWIGVID